MASGTQPASTRACAATARQKIRADVPDLMVLLEQHESEPRKKPSSGPARIPKEAQPVPAPAPAPVGPPPPSNDSQAPPSVDPRLAQLDNEISKDEVARRELLEGLQREREASIAAQAAFEAASKELKRSTKAMGRGIEAYEAVERRLATARTERKRREDLNAEREALRRRLEQIEDEIVGVGTA